MNAQTTPPIKKKWLFASETPSQWASMATAWGQLPQTQKPERPKLTSNRLRRKCREVLPANKPMRGLARARRDFKILRGVIMNYPMVNGSFELWWMIASFSFLRAFCPWAGFVCSALPRWAARREAYSGDTKACMVDLEGSRRAARLKPPACLALSGSGCCRRASVIGCMGQAVLWLMSNGVA